MSADTAPTIDLNDDDSAITINARRAGWALEAVKRFAALTGLDISKDADGIESAFGDLLGNMMHLADAYGLVFDDQARRSRELFYEAEKQEEFEERRESGVQDPITSQLVEQAAALAAAEHEPTEQLYVRAGILDPEASALLSVVCQKTSSR